MLHYGIDVSPAERHPAEESKSLRKWAPSFVRVRVLAGYFIEHLRAKFDAVYLAIGLEEHAAAHPRREQAVTALISYDFNASR